MYGESIEGTHGRVLLLPMRLLEGLEIAFGCDEESVRDDLGLEPSQRGAEADMASASEGEESLEVAIGLELVGPRVTGRVTIRSGETEQELTAGGNFDAREFDCLTRATRARKRGRLEAQRLLDEGRGDSRILAESFEHLVKLDGRPIDEEATMRVEADRDRRHR